MFSFVIDQDSDSEDSSIEGDKTSVTSTNNLDGDVWLVLNKIRADPATYVSVLEEQLSWFTNTDEPNLMVRQDSNVMMMTNEGPAAWEEAIAFLNA